jgi:hypothetical protein
MRYLVRGTLDLRIKGERDRVIKAGEAWFESGREQVHVLIDEAIELPR